MRIPIGLPPSIFLAAAALVTAGPAGSAGSSMALREAVDRVRTKVIVLKTARGNFRGFGTGFLARPGLVVTAGHVVDEVSAVTAWVNGVGYRADVLETHRNHDLAILGLRAPNLLLKPVELARATVGLREREPLVVVAGPAQSPAAMGDPTGRVGLPAGFTRRVRLRDPAGRLDTLLELAAEVEPGDSGSPVVRVRDASVVGVLSSRRTPGGDGISRAAYAVPAEVLHNWLDSAEQRAGRKNDFYLFRMR